MTYYLFGAGILPKIPPLIEKDSLIIAVDGGYRYLFEFGIKPNILIGDFDSLNKGFDIPNGIEVITLNPIKDNTDMIAAAQIAIDRGAANFKIYGGTGGRTGHLLANIGMLQMLENKKISATLLSDNEEIMVVSNRSVTFSADCCGFLSVFSLTEKSSGVYERGLKYTLTNYTMTSNNPIGVSNEFIGKESMVSVENGTLLIIKE